MIILSLFIVARFLHAQDNNLGPHGGRLKMVGDYKIELFGCDNYVEVYLFDRDTNAINNKDIIGSVSFYYKGDASLNSPLTRYGMDGFTARIPNNTFLYCKPSFDLNREFIITEKFENECLKRN